MVRGIGKRGDRPFLMFGLSDENIRRLRAGEPIAFALDDGMLGPNAPAYDIIMIWGATETDIAMTLHESFGAPESVTRIPGAGEPHKYAVEDDVDG